MLFGNIIKPKNIFISFYKFLPWNPYLKTDSSGHLILLSVKDAKHHHSTKTLWNDDIKKLMGVD